MNLLFASDSVVWASWRYIADEQVPSLCHNNEVVAAYVACGARMHLYAHLDKFGERALHCDTESVIFNQKAENPPLIECGDAIGDMISELKENDYISEFVSGAPRTMHINYVIL